MSSMGSSCSVPRQRGARSRNNSHEEMSPEQTARRLLCRTSSRHSVVSALPDDNIAALYPVQDNYVAESNGCRSPKSLVELSLDALCRSLPCLEGELPPGLPQDVIDDIVQSLIQHSALNATTLRILKNCELGALSLAGCRGVNDDWLAALSSGSTSPTFGSATAMDLDDHPDASSCSSSSFHSASSTLHDPLMEHASASQSQSMMSLDGISHDDDQDVPPPPPTDFYFNMSGRTTPSAITSSLTLLDLRGSQNLTDRGLLQLKDLGSLEVCRLDNCHALVGKGLIALANSHRLHTLSMANCRRLQDEAVVNISHLNWLENLSLDGCRCLTDRSLDAIAYLYQLRKLDLSQCDLLTEEGLHHLQDLEILEELSLGWCRLISDQGVDILTQQPGRREHLKILRLARCPLTDNGLDHVGRLAALEELDLNGCASIGSQALGNTLGRLTKLVALDVSYCPGILRSSWQGKIKNLRSLELCYSGVRDGHLSRLADLPALEEINLDSCPVGDWSISHLADNEVVPNLKSLDLADTDLTDLGMAHLPKFEKLTRLSLFYCNISNAGLRHIATMVTLEVLNLDSRDIGDDGLKHLRNLKNLKSLDIFSGRVTDAGCVHIAKIKSLESLELCGGGIGDLGCTILATIENLTSLNLSQNERIGNRGAAALAALSNLKALNLSHTRVSANALRYLSGLVKLQSLAVYGCRGMENSSSMDSFQNGLPNLKCLRLNTPSTELDGMVRAHHNDEESDSDSDEEVDFPIARHMYRGRFDSISVEHDDEEAEQMVEDEHDSHGQLDDASIYSDGD